MQYKNRYWTCTTVNFSSKIRTNGSWKDVFLFTVSNIYPENSSALPRFGLLHCYKTLRRIPLPWPDGAGPNGQGTGKWLLCRVREFAPSVTEVFRNHRKFPAIFPVKIESPCAAHGGIDLTPCSTLILSSTPTLRLPSIIFREIT